MSLEGIKKQILAEAEKEKKKILEEAGRKAGLLQKEAEERIVKLEEQFAKEIEDEKSAIQEQARIEAELSAKNNILRKKQELINLVFQKALEELKKEEEKEREKFLASFLGQARQDLGGELTIFPTSRDKEILEKLVGKYSGLKLASKTLKAQGGFLAESKDIEQDYTLENIIATQREELESEVAKILFS